jgi:hypothetical protein
MYHRDAKRQVHGVLNDFDLAILKDEARTLSTERTSTWPFMSIKLLRNLQGQLEHTYGA